MGDGFRELYRQSGLPVFQNRMYSSRHEARNCPKGDMRLVEDLKTGLVYNASFDESLMQYDAAYQNEQGNSELFRTHLHDVATLVETRMGKTNLVEVGCGKGAFLELLLERDVDITGFDPTYEGKNPRVRREYFSEELGMHGEGLILRHVLEHVQNPVDFLHRLARANGCRGLIYIEVPCFDWICTNRAWFDIFYEHVNYFRLTDFERIFGTLVHADHAFGGQYLRIVGDLASLRMPDRDPLDAAVFPDDFVARMASELASAPQETCVVWGGASKGVIFSLMRERAGASVDRVIDINPAKQGQYLAATGLQVMSPAIGLEGLTEGSVIHVMNPNYINEIRAMAGPNFIYKGMSND